MTLVVNKVKRNKMHTIYVYCKLLPNGVYEKVFYLNILFASGVFGTSGASRTANIFANLQKIQNGALGKMIKEKTESKKTRDSVP
jgi:hypothetical protein